MSFIMYFVKRLVKELMNHRKPLYLGRQTDIEEIDSTSQV